MGMNPQTYQMYVECMPILKAQEALETISCNDYPHINMKSRKKMHRSLWDQGNPFYEPPKFSADSFFGKAKVKSDG